MFLLPKTPAAALSGTLENISFVSEFDHGGAEGGSEEFPARSNTFCRNCTIFKSYGGSFLAGSHELG